MSSLWQYLEDLHGLSAVRAAWERGFGADFEAARGAFLTRTEEEARAYPSPHLCRCTLRVVPDGEGKFAGVSDCGSIGCRDVKLSRTDVLLWELNWRKLGTAIAEAFGCDGRDADLGIPGTRQIAVAGEGNVPVVLTIQNGQAGLRNAVGLLVARLQGPFVLLAPTRRFVDGVTQGLLANVDAKLFDLESHVSVLPGGKLRVDKAGKELFAAGLRVSGGQRPASEPCEGGVFYLFASPGGKSDQAGGSVFYKVEGETLAKSLCGLFHREYGDGECPTRFHYVGAGSVSEQEQVLLDETLDWLEVYDDPDPGVYDPEPSKEMIVHAQYGVRARSWEELLRRKIGRGGSAGGGGAPMEASNPQGAVGGPPRPEYLIRQEGTRRRGGKQDRTQVSTWRIWFRGHEVLMPEKVGSELVVYMIRKQGKEFNAATLTEAVRKSGPAGGNRNGEAAQEIVRGQDGGGDDGEELRGRVGDAEERDLIWDERDIAGCLRKIKGLVAEIKDHEDAGDDNSVNYLALKEKLEEQQDLLRANAKQVKGKWVPKEYRKGTFGQKADLIRKHVWGVLNGYLRDNCRPLFDHLNDRNTLTYGVKNRYQPKPRVEWVVQLKGDKTGM